MKDMMDKSTVDLVDQVRKPLGRPRIHASMAARQKAYRERKRAAGFAVVTKWVKVGVEPEQKPARPRAR